MPAVSIARTSHDTSYIQGRCTVAQSHAMSDCALCEQEICGQVLSLPCTYVYSRMFIYAVHMATYCALQITAM